MNNIRILCSYNSDGFYHIEEIQGRGYLSTFIEIDSKDYYEINFFSRGGLISEIKQSNFLGYTGIIVVKELILNEMILAVNDLHVNQLFFSTLKKYPVSKLKNLKEVVF
jgi:hypothetical protein